MMLKIISRLGGKILDKIRKSSVAGQFYEANNIALNNSIIECFLDDRGPGALPKINKGNKKVKGFVVPHAGYIYSGAIAAHSYDFLASNGFADTFIILGPNHTGMGSGVSIMTEGAWQTPISIVPINEKLAKSINKGIIDKDENAHYYEHSIEVQLPFLQYCAGNKKFDFVPICMAMQDFETSDEVGKIIADAIKKSDKNIVIIASSDFSHAGFNYMSMPPEGLRIDQFAEKQDKMAIKQILQINPKGLIDTVHLNNITMCGYGPVASMLTASKILGANKAELLKYGTSYEVHPSTSCVGYGALAVY
jgi:AmmeMemoRadiSam system protein B